MENALHISIPIWITIGVLSVVFSVFQGWNVSLDKCLKQNTKEMEIAQLQVNKSLLDHSFPQILAENQRIQVGSTLDLTKVVRAIDHTDGDISHQLEFYGTVNTAKKGVYTVRCVVRNSFGMKSVKHIQILVD